MKPKIIETKQDFHWHLVEVYLEMLSQIYAIHEDKVFCEKLEDLKIYLDKKLSLKCKGEIINTYVVVLQHPEE